MSDAAGFGAQASADAIHELPKAELHLHLEGSVSPDLFAQLRRKHGVADDPRDNAAGFVDLTTFLRAYDRICTCMRDADDFREVTRHALMRCAESNVRHVELFFSPHAHPETPYGAMLDGILDAAEAARSELGLTTLLIPAHSRVLGPERGMRFLDLVLSDRRPRIVGIGLDYEERPHPPAPFTDMYARARAEGLQVTAHAGEDGPAANVRDSVELLGCRRIDHGYHVVDDPELMERCRELDILFTVCPTTTLHTTIWRDLSDPAHAIRRMIEGGLRVTVNTDDPGLFHTELDREYRLLAEHMALSDETLRQIASNGLTHGWARAG